MSAEICVMSLLAVLDYAKCQYMDVPVRQPLKKSRTGIPESAPMEEFTLRRGAEPPVTVKIPPKKFATKPIRKSYPVGFSPMRRGSIASESIGEDDLCWSAPRIYKPEEKKEMLGRILRRNILMQHLSVESLEAVVDALEQARVESGQIVIREGEQGDGSFIVEEGTLDCSIRGLGHRCDYGPGDTFGEISLMYGNVRAATITAKTASVLWKLDRDTFKKIVLNAMMPTHAAFADFIGKVEVLDNLKEEEKDRVVKASQRLSYPNGSLIVLQGSESIERYLYLIVSGSVKFSQGSTDLCVKESYQYFGERSILWDECPKASVFAREHTEVYRIPATVVKSLPSALLDTLKQRSELMYV